MTRGLRYLLEGAVWVVAVGGLLAVVFVVSFWFGMRLEMRSTEVRVPELAGLTLDAARERVEPLQLALEIVDERNDPRVPSGAVLEQMPPAGVAVREGRTVKLVLSLGDRVLHVPAVVGESARAVVIELRREGFLPGDEARIATREMPAGRIVAQVPAPGAPAVPNTRVHRLVSDGPPPPAWVMPDLIGLERQRVERWVEDSGFRLSGVRRVPSRRRLPGTVVGQLPLPGYPVRSKDVIELTVVE